MARHADDDAAEDVDGGDDEAGDGVAAHELGGAVHGAEEGALLLELAAAAGRLLLVDQAGVEVGVDRHLLAGDGVEGEAGADLGDARGALGDDHEIDGDQDHEDDDADHEVAAHDEVGEAGDDVAGRRVALRAVGEDEARGGDVEREAQKGGDQQDGGEGREVERLLDPQRHHQDQHGERDREGEADVDQDSRQRQEQHREDEYDADGKAHVLGAAALDRLDARCNRARHRLPS